MRKLSRHDATLHLRVPRLHAPGLRSLQAEPTVDRTIRSEGCRKMGEIPVRMMGTVLLIEVGRFRTT